VERLDCLAPHTALNERPAGGGSSPEERIALAIGSAQAAGTPGTRAELRRRDEAQRVDRGLLEVRPVDLAPIRRVEVHLLRPRQCALDDRVRNPEALRKRPVAPLPALREEPSENVDVGILDREVGWATSAFAARRRLHAVALRLGRDG
jgi:hypothetical protein